MQKYSGSWVSHGEHAFPVDWTRRNIPTIIIVVIIHTLPPDPCDVSCAPWRRRVCWKKKKKNRRDFGAADGIVYSRGCKRNEKKKSKKKKKGHPTTARETSPPPLVSKRKEKRTTWRLRGPRAKTNSNLRRPPDRARRTGEGEGTTTSVRAGSGHRRCGDGDGGGGRVRFRRPRNTVVPETRLTANGQGWEGVDRRAQNVVDGVRHPRTRVRHPWPVRENPRETPTSWGACGRHFRARRPRLCRRLDGITAVSAWISDYPLDGDVSGPRPSSGKSDSCRKSAITFSHPAWHITVLRCLDAVMVHARV